MRPGRTARRRRRHGLTGVVATLGLALGLLAVPSLPPAGAAPPNPSSLRLGGSGARTPGADRVLLPVDPPTAADVGATDFTIEWWMAATAADNATGAVPCDTPGYSWYLGHAIVDRDRYPDQAGTDGRDFGASVTADGRLAFGVQNAQGQAWTTCTAGVNVLDGAWHHVALQRATSGLLQIWVDGALRAEAYGPAGDVSYPDRAPARQPSADPFLVLGAAKHDSGGPEGSYRGLLDEVRISTGRRYSAAFRRPTGPFTPDASTAALLHLDGPAGACPATLADAAGKVSGRCVGAAGLPALAATVPSWRGEPAPPAAPGPPAGTSSLHPMTPRRLADTRPTPLKAGGVLQVQVAGRAGVPANATAAALNLTVTDGDRPGYLTAWPCGQPQPLASNVNHAPGQTVANLAMVTLGAGGTVCIVSAAGANVIVDVTGWWAPGGLGFGAVAPARIADTRPARVAGGGVLEVAVAGRNGVPATARAAALNITAVGAAGPGYVTAWPCGDARPLASNLNHDRGQTVANLAVVALGPGGTVCLYASATTALVVDLAGWFGPGGLAHARPGSVPTRVLDTRPSLVPAGGVVRVPVPAGSAVSALNVTVTGPTAAGYVSAFPCDQPTPSTSNLNFGPGQTAAAAVLVPPSTDGTVCLFTSAPAFLLADVFGAMAVADVSTQALGARLYALQWGFTQLGAPYAAINPYRFGDSTWGRRWPCPSGWTSCSLVDMHGGVRTADTGDWVYDCSGFAVAAYQRAGVDLVKLNAGWSDAMYRSLPRVPVDQARPGDLLLFGEGEARPSDPTVHVGLFLTADRMLNATTACGGWQGVCTSAIDWSRVVAVARAPLPGPAGLVQDGPASYLDPYSGVE